MALVLQMQHDPAHLDLGGDDHVLHLFQCASEGCSSYGYDSGSTAGMILRCSELGDGLTKVPPSAGAVGGRASEPVCSGIASASAFQVQLNGELWLTHWTEHDDGFLPEDAPAFFDPARFDALPKEQAAPYGFDFRWNTRVGSVPLWSGSGVAPEVSAVPRPPFTFLMQIDNMIALPGPAPTLETAGCDRVILSGQGQPQRIERVAEACKRANAPRFIAVEPGGGEGYSAHFANFSMDGSMYVLLDRTTTPPRPACFWSR